ncbi:MAG: chemotaxis protein CheX [Spirochaetota bacterium]|nr:chemotaxis protein CheX [Spirochaetota bacterium]
MSALKLNDALIDAIIRSTLDGLSMANVVPDAVGAGRYVTARHEVSSIIGFVGAVVGSVSINMTVNAAKYLAGRIVGGNQDEMTPEALDAICEILNIIAGKLKAILSNSELKIEKISVPSVVVGNNFSLTHYRGMQTLSVEFEIPDAIKTHHTSDYVFSVSMSMMRSS